MEKKRKSWTSISPLQPFPANNLSRRRRSAAPPTLPTFPVLPVIPPETFYDGRHPTHLRGKFERLRGQRKPLLSLACRASVLSLPFHHLCRRARSSFPARKEPFPRPSAVLFTGRAFLPEPSGAFERRRRGWRTSARFSPKRGRVSAPTQHDGAGRLARASGKYEFGRA